VSIPYQSPTRQSDQNAAQNGSSAQLIELVAQASSPYITADTCALPQISAGHKL